MATPFSLYRRLPALRRRSRRIAVVAAFVGFPLMLVGYSSLVATGVLSTIIWAPIAIGLLTATLVGAFAIYGYGQGRMDRDRLDERQRTVVDRALVISYGVLTTAIVAVAGVLAVYLSFIGTITIEMTTVTPWIVAIGLYVPLLPFAVLAWIEPDAPSDDDER